MGVFRIKPDYESSTWTTLPTPKNIVYSKNKLWSENTGRLDNGYFVGELVAIKRKYEVTFPPISATQLQTIMTWVNRQQGFAYMEITNAEGSSDTADVYFGDINVESYSWHNGIQYAINATVSIIER